MYKRYIKLEIDSDEIYYGKQFSLSTLYKAYFRGVLHHGSIIISITTAKNRKRGDRGMIIYLQTIDDSSDRTKFEQLYLMYRAFMYQIAYHILQNKQDAEDAVHNAFLSIAKNIEKVRDPMGRRTQGYIFIIVERKAIDLYRERKLKESDELNEDKIGISYPPPDDHDLVWCITQLPPRYRQMIFLKYSHGYTVKEIAEILGISHAAASKLDQRAKKKLEEICREEGIL